jgi:hypothetical protein
MMEVLKPDTVVSTEVGTVKILNSFYRNGQTGYTVVTVDNKLETCYHEQILYVIGE